MRLCLKFFLEQPYCTNSYSEYVHMLARDRKVEKLVLRLVRTKWMAPNKLNVVEYFLCIGPAKNTKASLPARKIMLFSSIIITVIFSYMIIKIYTILHIYLQVSETEGLTELY